MQSKHNWFGLILILFLFNLAQAQFTGAKIFHNTTSSGYFNAGSSLDPDVVSTGFRMSYYIVQPNKYNPVGYGTDYNFTFNAITEGGRSVGHWDGFWMDGPLHMIYVEPSDSLKDSIVCLQLTVHDLNNGQDTVLNRCIKVISSPSASFSIDDQCFGDSTHFTHTSTYDSTTILQVRWEFDDPDSNVLNDTSVFTNPSYLYQKPGMAVVRLTVWDSVYPRFASSSIDTIRIFNLPVISLFDTNACVAVPFFYYALGDSGYHYHWDIEDDGRIEYSTHRITHIFSQTGLVDISLRIIDSNGCMSVEAIAQIDVGRLEVQLRDSTVCSDSLTLDPGKFTSYQWSTSDTSRTLTIDSSGVYSVVVKDQYGCQGYTGGNYEILGQPETPVLSKHGELLRSSVSGVQWFRNDTLLANETSDSLLATIFGVYTAVQVTDSGCISDTSNALQKTAYILAKELNNIYLHPNPTQDKVHIENSDLTSPLTIIIYGPRGRNFLQNSFDAREITISLPETQGLYVLEVRSNDKLVRFKIVKL
ncbi:MAG: T9SS type A sorting domain-containing protein [Bacteroidia bacterium]